MKFEILHSFLKFWIFIILLGSTTLVRARYQIDSHSAGTYKKICLSNQSPARALEHYWNLQRVSLTDGRMACKIGNSARSQSTSANIKLLIQTVQETPTEINLHCRIDDDKGTSINLYFDGVEDNVDGAKIVSCDDSTIISDVRLMLDPSSIIPKVVDAGSLPNGSNNGDIIRNEITRTSIEDMAGDTREEAVKFISRLDMEEMKSLRDQLAEIRAHRDSLIRQLEKQEHETASIRSSLRSIHELEKADNEEALRELREKNEKSERLQSALSQQIRKLEDENLQMQSRIQFAIEREKKREQEMLMTNSATTLRPLSTMTHTPVTTIISLLSSAVSAFRNNWVHSYNRPGSGVYLAVKDSSDDEGCKTLSYMKECKGFELLLDKRKFPFFNAHVHHRSIVEAMHDGIIAAGSDYKCDVKNESKDVCFREMSQMDARCPPAIKNAYYIDSKGNYRVITCSQENHELTEDCNFCRRLERSDQTQVAKNGVPLQDAVCQPSTSTLSGRKPTPRGYCSIGIEKYKNCDSGHADTRVVPFVVMQGAGKFYLDKMVIKNIEHKSPDNFLCFKHSSGSGSSSMHEGRDLVAVNATECHCVDKTKSEECTGDAVFCSLYQCSEKTPKIRCELAPGSGPLFVLIKGDWHKPKCLGYERTKVILESRVTLTSDEQQCRACNYECLDSGIQIRSPGFRMTSAVACSHGSCVSTTQVGSTQIMVPYPGHSLSSGGSIGVRLSHDEESLSSHIIVKCPPRDSCDLHDCILCKELILNFQCHSVLSGLFLSMTIGLTLYMSWRLVGFVLSRLSGIKQFSRSPFKWAKLLVKWGLRKIQAQVQRKFRALNNNIGWQDDVEEVVVARNRVAALRPLQRYTYSLTVFMSIICLASPCTETVVASSKIVKCTQSGSSSVCRVNGIITMKAGMIGTESCLLLKGPNIGQQKLLSIKTLSSESTCREGQSFWTGQFAPKCFSSRRCHLVGECHRDRCQEWNNEVVSSEFSHMGETNSISENKCFEQCGGIGCSCFNVNPSCLFTHTRLESTRNEALRVFSCVDWVHGIQFEVSDSSTTKTVVKLGSLGVKFFEWGSMSLSLNANSISGSNSLTFLQSSRGGFALADENFPEYPREGFIGEIRCNSEAAVLSAHKSCAMAPNLIKYRPMQEQAECSTNLIDPFAIFLKGALPQSRNGMTFMSSMNKQTVQAINSGSVEALITLSIEDYEVTFKNEIPECKMSFLNMSGCYSCDIGASVCFLVEASAEASLHAHSEDMSLSFAFHASPTKKHYCQMQHFSRAVIDEQLLYGCGDEEQSINIKGLLVAVPVSSGRLNNTVMSTVVNPSTSGLSITGWFSSLVGWSGGILKTIAIIVCFVIGGLLAIVIIKNVICVIITRGILKKQV
ncbi:glycoprotein precursor [Tico virus]|uniref:Envelopment polyprotein n=1 Tax=Tico virus TaxID=2846448 RepID=A0A482KC17_9VIRU|nr:glycoprotein precursor [Tico virus]QBQ01765.1 glycoprotein precursor [Tico virus]